MNPKDADFDSLVPGRPVSRRSFLAGAAAAGFALAVRPAPGEAAVQTPAAGLVAGGVTVNASDGVALAAYRAKPDGRGPFPVVLVVQEIFGVHEHIRDVCRRLAHEGYLAIAPELFQRQGDPSTLQAIPEIQQKIVSKVPDAQVLQDLDAAAAWAVEDGGDPKRVAITGFCWGGRITWLYAAHSPQLKAGVAWYGRLRGNASEFTPRHPLELAAALKAPVLGLYGGQDQGIPVADVEAMRAAMRAATQAAGRAAELVVYPDAGHAFHADYRPSYREADARDGWRRMLAWFRKNGV